jgi:hypothetical protein
MNALYAAATKWLALSLAPAAIPVAGASYFAFRPIEVPQWIPPAEATIAHAEAPPPTLHPAPIPEPPVLTLRAVHITATPPRAALNPNPEERVWVCESRSLAVGRLHDVVRKAKDSNAVTSCSWQSAVTTDLGRIDYKSIKLR